MNKHDLTRAAFNRAHGDLFGQQARYVAEFFNYSQGSYDPAEGEMSGQSRSSIGTATVEVIPPTQDSLVFEIKPSSDLQAKDVEPIWGIVDSITDQRNNPLNNIQYELTVTVLAFGSEYSSHTDIEADLQT